jgi:tRNA (guanine-N7-)-methyltransferase
MIEVLDAEPGLANTAGDSSFIERPERGLTRFENRGRRLGHRVYDLEYRRA